MIGPVVTRGYAIGSIALVILRGFESSEAENANVFVGVSQQNSLASASRNNSLSGSVQTNVFTGSTYGGQQ